MSQYTIPILQENERTSDLLESTNTTESPAKIYTTFKMEQHDIDNKTTSRVLFPSPKGALFTGSAPKINAQVNDKPWLLEFHNSSNSNNSNKETVNTSLSTIPITNSKPVRTIYNRVKNKDGSSKLVLQKLTMLGNEANKFTFKTMHKENKESNNTHKGKRCIVNPISFNMIMQEQLSIIHNSIHNNKLYKPTTKTKKRHDIPPEIRLDATYIDMPVPPADKPITDKVSDYNSGIWEKFDKYTTSELFKKQLFGNDADMIFGNKKKNNTIKENEYHHDE